jgi:hypothetical protein
MVRVTFVMGIEIQNCKMESKHFRRDASLPHGRIVYKNNSFNKTFNTPPHGTCTGCRCPVKFGSQELLGAEQCMKKETQGCLLLLSCERDSFSEEKGRRTHIDTQIFILH